jgi:hypothetical protein
MRCMQLHSLIQSINYCLRVCVCVYVCACVGLRPTKMALISAGRQAPEFDFMYLSVENKRY